MQPQSPVTVIARHKVRPGCEEIFENWVVGIAGASQSFEGYLGTEVIRPLTEAENEFVAIFRFNTYEHLRIWTASSERLAWTSKTDSFSDEASRVVTHGLEFLFLPNSAEGRGPKRYKMALVTFLVIWPLVHFIPPIVAKALGARPLAIEATSVAVIVLLMTYFLMPAATRLLRPILFPRS